MTRGPKHNYTACDEFVPRTNQSRSTPGAKCANCNKSVSAHELKRAWEQHGRRPWVERQGMAKGVGLHPVKLHERARRPASQPAPAVPIPPAQRKPQPKRAERGEGFLIIDARVDERAMPEESFGRWG